MLPMAWVSSVRTLAVWMQLGLWGLGLAACSASPVAPDRDPAAPLLPDKSDASTADEDASTGPRCEPPEFLIIQPKGTEASIRMGWRGVGHNVRLNDGVSTAVRLFDCSDDCRTCRFSGPVPVPNSAVDNQRCTLATAKKCSSDDACGSNDVCRYFLGPSVNVSMPGEIRLSAVAYFEPLETKVTNGSILDESPIQGTLDLVTGQSTISSLNIKIATALFGAKCVGDPTPFDGPLSGSCEGVAPYIGPPIACDVSGIGPDGNRSSYECPQWGGDVVPVAIQLAPLKTTDQTWQLEADSPDCGSAPGKKCFCGTCDDPPNKMCHRDIDCAGRCEPAVGTKPDACKVPGLGCYAFPDLPGCDATCFETDEERGVGRCTVRLEGSAVPTLHLDNGSCFTDDGVLGAGIRAKGMADSFDKDGVANVTMAALACMPPSNSAVVGQAFGLPGPASIELPVISTLVGGDGSWRSK